jgi:hypothetical protein
MQMETALFLEKIVFVLDAVGVVPRYLERMV